MSMLEHAAQLRLPSSGKLAKPVNPMERHAMDAPAIAVMTDFRREQPSVVSAKQHVDAALNDMILDGVRALLVVEDQSVVGLVTASDILGPRPIQFLQNPLCDGSPCQHQHVHVGDIMTNWADLRLLRLEWVDKSSCGDVASAFAAHEASHLLVVERVDDGSSFVRGIFSRTRLARQLPPS